MATIVRLNSGYWRAQIRRRKVTCENKTFADESSARRWAATREAENPMLDTYEMLPCNSREVRIQQKDEAALDEVAILWSRLNRTNKSFLPWMQFVRGTGSRPGESARIRLDWLNLAESKIDMPRSGQKKRNPRLIVLGPALVEVLRKQLALARQAGSAYLFWSVNPRTKKPVPFAYHKPWARVCKYAGLSNLGGAHSMRHEFISRLYEHTELTDGMIAALVGDVNPLSLAPYRHLRVAALPDKSAEHMLQMAALYTVAQRQLTKQREVVEGDDDWLLEPVSISLKDL